MTQIQWDKLNDSDIRKLITQGEHEISRRTAAKRKDAKQKLAAVAREYGFKLDELVETGSAGGAYGRTYGRLRSAVAQEPKAKLPPKYRCPTDASLTWSGHGKRPMWAKAHLEAGGALADLLIRKGRAANTATPEKAKAKPVQRGARKAKTA